MSNADLLKIFLGKTYTKIDAQRRLRILRDFENWRIFEQSSKPVDKLLIGQFLDSKLQPQDQRFRDGDERFLVDLGAEVLNWFDQSNLSSGLAEVENGIAQTKQVTLYIAFDLPHSEIERLGMWLKENVGLESLLDIQYRGELIGGVAISYRGVLKDYSIRSQIEAHKQDILKSLLDFRQ